MEKENTEQRKAKKAAQKAAEKGKERISKTVTKINYFLRRADKNIETLFKLGSPKSPKIANRLFKIAKKLHAMGRNTTDKCFFKANGITKTIKGDKNDKVY